MSGKEPLKKNGCLACYPSKATFKSASDVKVHVCDCGLERLRHVATYTLKELQEKLGIDIDYKTRSLKNPISVKCGQTAIDVNHTIKSISTAKGLFSDKYRTEHKHNMICDKVHILYPPVQNKLCDVSISIELGGGYENKKLDNRYEAIKGGYLLECDNYGITERTILHVDASKGVTRSFDDTKYVIRALVQQSDYSSVVFSNRNRSFIVDLKNISQRHNDNSNRSMSSDFPHVRLFSDINIFQHDLNDEPQLNNNNNNNGNNNSNNNNNNNNNNVSNNINVNMNINYTYPVPMPLFSSVGGVYPYPYVFGQNHFIVNNNNNLDITNQNQENFNNISQQLQNGGHRSVNASDDPQAPPKKRQRRL